jgi:hypothetical protein
MNRPFGSMSRIGVVSHHDDRLLELDIQPVHQIQNFRCGFCVEVTGWFVSHD